MSAKLFLTALLIVSLALPSSAGVADQNARLKLLIERAKARKAAEAAQPNVATPAPVTVAPVAVPVTPVVVPVAVPRTPIAMPTVSSPVKPTAPVRVRPVSTPAPVAVPAATPLPERKAKVLETHPKIKVEPVKEAAPVETPQAPAVQALPVAVPVTTIIETKNAVVQPATQTLINTPSFSSTPANSIIQNSVIHSKQVPVPKFKEELITQPNIETKTESYDNVLKSIDEILKGQKVEEQASQKPKTKAIELDAKPTTPKSDLKSELKNKDNNNLINEGVAAAVNGTSATTDKDADYLLVLRKSLKSLEEDSWANVKLNMGEALDYFAKEKKLYPNNPKLNTYYKIILGFQRFSEGGLELDEGDFADFEDAEALYLDTQDLLEEAQKELSKDYNGDQASGIVGTVLKYTEEELQYIEEVLGM